MGTYTALYGRITLKHDIAKVLYQPGADIPNWERLKKCRGLAPHPDVKEFIYDPRRNSIGRGCSAYFNWFTNELDDWDEILDAAHRDGWRPDSDWADAEVINYDGMRYYNPQTRELTFFCSLKNYSNTIEAFLTILPLIADDWLLFREYEMSDVTREPDRVVPTWRRPKVTTSLIDHSLQGLDRSDNKIYAGSHDDSSKVIHLPVTVLTTKQGPAGTAIEPGEVHSYDPSGYGY